MTRTLIGSPTGAPAPTVYKGSFDGTGAVGTGPNPGFTFATASGGRSLEAWIKLSSVPAADGNHMLWGSGDGWAGDAFGRFMNFRPQRQIANYTGWRFNAQFRSPSAGVSSRFYGSTELVAETWYHVVFRTNGSAWSLYLNGAAETITFLFGANTGEWMGDLFSTADRAAAIGNAYSRGSFGTNYASDMQIRRVTLWDGELTATDIANLYAEGYNGDPADATVVGATMDNSWDFTGQDTLDQVGVNDFTPLGAWDDATDIIVSP